MKNKTYDKTIRNGKVAVLVSPDFGAGWSTWNENHPELLFDPEVVALVEADRKDDIEEVMNARYGKNAIYCGGTRGLEIEWLPLGTEFRIDEYDGSESIETKEESNGITA